MHGNMNVKLLLGFTEYIASKTFVSYEVSRRSTDALQFQILFCVESIKLLKNKTIGIHKKIKAVCITLRNDIALGLINSFQLL
jgi:hypothetical protein